MLVSTHLRGKALDSRKWKNTTRRHPNVAFIREKTYTLPITLGRGLRIRARTKKGKEKKKTREARSCPLGRLEIRKHVLYPTILGDDNNAGKV